jgi:hypothetical protein
MNSGRTSNNETSAIRQRDWGYRKEMGRGRDKEKVGERKKKEEKKISNVDQGACMPHRIYLPPTSTPPIPNIVSLDAPQPMGYWAMSSPCERTPLSRLPRPSSCSR